MRACASTTDHRPSTTANLLTIANPSSEDTPTPSPTETGYTADDDGAEDDNFIAECLKEPKPVEYYGTATLWPSFIDVEYAGAMYCER